MFPIISPGAAKIEYNVSSSSLGPATLANNLSPNTTSSERTPSLTNKHDASFTCALAPLINLYVLFVPHSSSATQI